MGSWSDQCPARQPGLVHMHDFEDCGKVHALHPDGVCCECGQSPAGPPVPRVIEVREVLERELNEIVEKYWRDQSGGEG